MAAAPNHVLARLAAGFQKVYLAVTGGAVAQAAMLVQTGADGFIDDSMIHPTLVPAPISLPAAVAIGAGKQVNIFNNGGTESVQLADATLATPLRSDGFVLNAVALGAPAKVYRRGGVNTALTGLTQDADYYLGAAGAVTVTQNTTLGQLDQYIGKAIAAAALDTLQPQPGFLN